VLNPQEEFKVIETISVESNLTKAKSFIELPDALVIAFTTNGPNNQKSGNLKVVIPGRHVDKVGVRFGLIPQGTCWRYI
jgi:hypothetical protein